MRFVWRFLMMPLLFGLIGASMVFRTLTQSSIPKACAIVIAGKHQAWLTGPLSGLLCPAACLYMPGCLLIGPSCSRVLHSIHAGQWTRTPSDHSTCSRGWGALMLAQNVVLADHLHFCCHGPHQSVCRLAGAAPQRQ